MRFIININDHILGSLHKQLRIFVFMCVDHSFFVLQQLVKCWIDHLTTFFRKLYVFEYEVVVLRCILFYLLFLHATKAIAQFLIGCVSVLASEKEAFLFNHDRHRHLSAHFNLNRTLYLLK